MVEDDREQLVLNDENGAWGRSCSDREENRQKLRVFTIEGESISL